MQQGVVLALIHVVCCYGLMLPPFVSLCWLEIVKGWVGYYPVPFRWKSIVSLSFATFGSSWETICSLQMKSCHTWWWCAWQHTFRWEEICLNVIISCCMLHIFSIPQCWMTSQESTSGIFTDQGRIAEYEQQWHSIIFSPCLKKLRAEVSVYMCSFNGC